jgi:hypothetical protein
LYSEKGAESFLIDRVFEASGKPSCWLRAATIFPSEAESVPQTEQQPHKAAITQAERLNSGRNTREMSANPISAPITTFKRTGVSLKCDRTSTVPLLYHFLYYFARLQKTIWCFRREISKSSIEL